MGSVCIHVNKVRACSESHYGHTGHRKLGKYVSIERDYVKQSLLSLTNQIKIDDVVLDYFTFPGGKIQQAQ